MHEYQRTEEINAKLQLTDATKVELNEESQTIFLLEEGMRIDLGCIAKGYIADLVIEQLKDLGVTSALINLGGNVLTLGPAVHHEDGNWWIGIQTLNSCVEKMWRFFRFKMSRL